MTPPPAGRDEAPAAPPPPVRHNVPALLVLLLAAGGLLVVAALIFLPFVAPIVLALVVATTAYPLFEKFQRLTGSKRRGPASALTCLVLILIVFLPLAWVGWSLAQQVKPAVEWTAERLENAQSRIDESWLNRQSWFKPTWQRAKKYIQSLRESELLTGPDGKPITIPPMRNLTDNMQALVDEAAEGGVEFLVCASTPINTLDDIKASIDVLNKTDEACKKAGIGFAYHNHDAEFRAVEGQIPYELFLSQTKMQMELDLAWATKGGKDPVELFKQHPGRFPLWHVKDLDAKRETVLPVGEGTIDFKRIFDAASTSGMKHFFVEHDMPKDPLASIKTSFSNINKILG
jgi:hypothetical protein